MPRSLLAGLVAASMLAAVGCVTHEKEVVEKPAPVVVTPPPQKVEVVQPPPDKVIVVPSH
jgi:hypothetical protein